MPKTPTLVRKTTKKPALKGAHVSHHRKPVHTGPIHKILSSKIALAAFVIGIGAVGSYLVFATHADSLTPAPIDFAVRTGGNSIAVVWQPNANNLKSVEVYRNNVLTATILPGTGFLTPDKLAMRYIDKAVTPGKTYAYKVRSVDTAGNTSEFTPAITVVDPLATKTTKVPTVTFDTTKADIDLTAYLNTYVRPEIQTWYPKVADEIAYPAYVAPAAIQVVVDKTYDGVAETSNNTIRISSSWLSDPTNQANAAVWIHELTHVIQSYIHPDPTGWATEGMASWASNWFALASVETYVPDVNDQLTMGYSTSALFMQYMTNTYDKGFVRKLNLTLYKGTYATNFVPSEAGGKSADTVWAYVKSLYRSAPIAIASVANQCVTDPGDTSILGTIINLTGCTGATGQQWQRINRAGNGLVGGNPNQFEITAPGITGQYSPYCLDVRSSGTADGTPVQLWLCNGTSAQTWSMTPSGLLMNLNSGKCLNVTYPIPDSGSPLYIQDCDASNQAQQWSFGFHQTTNGHGGKTTQPIYPVEK